MQEKHLEDTVGAEQLAADRFFAEQDAARQKWKMKKLLNNKSNKKVGV